MLNAKIRRSSGYPLSISSCYIVSNQESNVVLEQIIAVKAPSLQQLLELDINDGGLYESDDIPAQDRR